MNNYEIYILDTVLNKAILLDSTDVDFTTTFAIADVKDLLVRRDVITKDLTFNFSEVNNKAFGYAFMSNKHIDEADNTPLLGGNYNPQLIVPCKVYENGSLILEGNLRLKTVKKDTYEVVITGNVIEFTSLIGDLELADLDITDMQHTFSVTEIKNSWTGTRDYVYPLIQYGEPLRNTDLLNVVNPYAVKNFKPAVFVKSIFNRVFADAGFTYEVKGSNQFLDIFNKLIIPNNIKQIINRQVVATAADVTTLNKTQTDTRNEEFVIDINNLIATPIRLDGVTDSLGLFTNGANYAMLSNNASVERAKPMVVFNANRTFTSTASLNYSVSYFNNNGGAINMGVQFISRDVVSSSDIGNYHKYNGWDVITEDIYRLPYQPSNNPWVAHENTLVIPSTTYEVGKQYMVRLYFYIVDPTDVTFNSSRFNYECNRTTLTFPELIGQSIDVNVGIGEITTPTLPTGVKQLDFLNSICSLFNLYKYIDPDNDKNVILEEYDSYYSMANEQNLIANALDWTGYVDFSGDYENASNLDIPKNYNFRWKEDKDYLNNFYQEKYSKSYADLQVTDSRGILDKKEISLIFSPTITSGGYAGDNKAYFNLPVPYIYGVNSGVTETLDTNIRLLVWNGLRTSEPYTIISESFDANNNSWNRTSEVSTVQPLASNYYLDVNGNALYDIHFGSPNEVFFLLTSKYNNAVQSYVQYQNQISELKSANVTYLTCQMYLKPQTISELSLKRPVYVDLGKHGTSYWKVLSVNYRNAETRSTVKLQKIV